MRTLVMVVALLGTWMAHAQQTKTLYGQTYTREEFEELKESIRPKPGWKAGEAGVRERIEELKRRSAGQEAEYARQESDIASGEAVFELSLPKGFEPVVLTSIGTIDLGFVGPAAKVLLYKPAADKKHRVKSVWKKLP